MGFFCKVYVDSSTAWFDLAPEQVSHLVALKKEALRLSEQRRSVNGKKRSRGGIIPRNVLILQVVNAQSPTLLWDDSNGGESLDVLSDLQKKAKEPEAALFTDLLAILNHETLLEEVPEERLPRHFHPVPHEPEPARHFLVHLNLDSSTCWLCLSLRDLQDLLNIREEAFEIAEKNYVESGELRTPLAALLEIETIIEASGGEPMFAEPTLGDVYERVEFWSGRLPPEERSLLERIGTLRKEHALAPERTLAQMADVFVAEPPTPP